MIGAVALWGCVAFSTPLQEWEAVPSGTQESLRAVYFGDDSHAWAVGDKGTMVSSSNGGKTWAAQKSESDGTLRGLHFLDASNGWIVGDGDSAAPPPRGHIVMNRPMKSGTCLITSDAGKTWNRVWVPTNFELRSIWMASKNVGQICNHGGAQHPDGDRFLTADGGRKWSQTRVYRGLNDSFWVDEKTACAVGSPVAVGFFPTPQDDLYTQKSARIVMTRDGGVTWKPVDAGRGGELRSVWFANKSHGVAVGDRGTIHQTADGGATWSTVTAGVTANLWGVTFANANLGWIVGDQGTILETRDGGKAWTPAKSPTQKTLFGVHAPSHGKTAVAVGAEGTLVRLK